MLSESSKDQEPPERRSGEIDCFVSEEFHSNNKIEDYSNESQDRYWLDLFRHALKEDDQRIQKWLQQKFSAFLFDWIYDHPESNLVCRLHAKEYYVIETFRCFWNTLHNQQKFDFVSMADVLSHLHVNMNGVILDTLRNYSSPQYRPLTSISMSGEAPSNENDSIHEIWGLIEGKLSNARERRMAYLLFQCALKPGEIVGRFPNEFSDVNEISRIRRNIMEFLNRGDQMRFAMNKIS